MVLFLDFEEFGEWLASFKQAGYDVLAYLYMFVHS